MLVNHLMKAAIVAAVLALSVSAFGVEIAIVPEGPQDMGSGPTTSTHLYYPGGIPGGLGMILGQPNLLTRNDRALVRFDISKLALFPNPAERLKKAELKFQLYNSYIRDIPSTVEVSQLSHDTALGFVGTDLLREPSKIVAKLTVREPKTMQYSFDITQAVIEDINKGRKYTSYRWRNVTAEKDGNIFVKEWFVKLDADSASMPTLVLSFDDGGK